MTKQELLAAINELPDCYEIDGPGGDPLAFRVDRQKAKVIVGVPSRYNSSGFAPLELGRPCRHEPSCCHYDPIKS